MAIAPSSAELILVYNDSSTNAVSPSGMFSSSQIVDITRLRNPQNHNAAAGPELPCLEAVGTYPPLVISLIQIGIEKRRTLNLYCHVKPAFHRRGKSSIPCSRTNCIGSISALPSLWWVISRLLSFCGEKMRRNPLLISRRQTVRPMGRSLRTLRGGATAHLLPPCLAGPGLIPGRALGPLRPTIYSNLSKRMIHWRTSLGPMPILRSLQLSLRTIILNAFTFLRFNFPTGVALTCPWKREALIQRHCKMVARIGRHSHGRNRAFK